MKIGPAFHTALSGVKNGMRRLDQNAAEVADSAGKPDEAAPTRPLVESKINQRQIEANARMLKTADDMLGTLLDEKA